MRTSWKDESRSFEGGRAKGDEVSRFVVLVVVNRCLLVLARIVPYKCPVYGFSRVLARVYLQRFPTCKVRPLHNQSENQTEVSTVSSDSSSRFFHRP